MFQYFYRIYDRFDEEVYAIALLTSERKSNKPDYFHYAFHGTTVNYTYNTYKFHEQSISELEKRSEEHTSELQSRGHLVCRLLLEKKKLKHTSNKQRLSQHH